MNLLDRIIDYEQGDMDEEEIIDFFQDLINSGMAWTLQGSYGRTAQALIEVGICHPARSVPGQSGTTMGLAHDLQ